MMSRYLATFLILTAMLQSLVSQNLAAQSVLENEHDCFVVPDAVANIGSPVRGIIANVLVERGDTVVEGQAIATLESRAERILLSHAEARADMNSDMTARESDYELSKLELARIEDLHKQGIAPTQQLDEARVSMKIAHAGFLQSIESQKLALIELEQASHELAKRTLKSPMNGVVVEQYVESGEFIFDEPVMSIATLNPLRVEVVLPASMFGTIESRDNALITTELNSLKPYQAQVEIVDALLDSRSGTFGVSLALPNQDFAITAGQRCTVDFTVATNSIELAEEER